MLVISDGKLGAEMGGNEIRALELARALSGRAQVTVAAPAVDLELGGIAYSRHDPLDPRAIRDAVGEAEVIVAQPQSPMLAALLRRSGARLVYDLYDPKPLEIFEAFAGASRRRQRFWWRLSLDHYCTALADADLVLCASERQRDLWIGAMLALGVITPDVYGADPTLRRVIDVVPYGLPAQGPSAAGRGPYDRFAALEPKAEIVLWNGGIWNWLDPTTAVEAIVGVAEQRPLARLVFMSRGPRDGGEARAARGARDRAAELGVLDRLVFFNDAHVPYAQRGDWLLAADCAIVLALDDVETRYAFRTRLLDCFWSGLPVVCSSGDELSERVEQRGLGAVVDRRDVEAVAQAITRVLERGREAYGAATASVAHEYRWTAVSAPLLGYVGDLPPARDRVAAPVAIRARGQATRVLRGAARSLHVPRG